MIDVGENFRGTTDPLRTLSRLCGFFSRLGIVSVECSGVISASPMTIEKHCARSIFLAHSETVPMTPLSENNILFFETQSPGDQREQKRI